MLPYTDYNNLWLTPFAHTFFYGVVKDFINAILDPLPRQKEGPSLLSGRQAVADARIQGKVRQATCITGGRLVTGPGVAHKLELFSPLQLAPQHLITPQGQAIMAARGETIEITQVRHVPAVIAKACA